MRSSREVKKYQSRLGSPSGKKSKKLAAICEEEYNKNHGEPKERDGGSGLACADSELRRSSRVRRIPSILDASPPPPKKRQRFNNHGDRSSKGNSSVGREVREENGDLDTPDGWKSRLRSRSRNVGFQASGRQRGVVKGKRKLVFRNRSYESREKAVAREREEERGAPNGGKLMKTKKKVEVKESESSEDGEKESDTSNAEDESSSESEESTQADSEAGEEDEKEKTTKRSVVLESENEAEVDGMETESEDGTDSTENEIEDSDEEGESETQGSAEKTGSEIEANVDETTTDTNVIMETVETENGNQMDGLENEIEMEVDGIGNKEVGVMVSESGNGTGILGDDSDFADNIKKKKEDTSLPELLQKASIEVNESSKQNDDIREQGVSRTPSSGKTKEHSEFLDRGGESVEMLDELPIQNETCNKVVDSICTSSDRLGKPLFKQARRCGLCGVGTDGKHPKKLIQDNGDSDIEAHSGSSSSEEPTYDILDGFGDDPGWLGRLLGPINDRYGISGTWVHQHCAVWSPEVLCGSDYMTQNAF